MTSYYAKSKKFAKANHNRGLALLSVLIVFSVVFLGLLYLIQTNSLVGHSYKIREQKEYLRKLESKNHDLEIEIARLQSPINLQEMIESLGLIEVSEIIYLNGEKTMAVKEQ